jgi:hypothetical protein
MANVRAAEGDLPEMTVRPVPAMQWGNLAQRGDLHTLARGPCQPRTSRMIVAFSESQESLGGCISGRDAERPCRARPTRRQT